MLPHSQPRPPKNSSRVNLTISLVFHAVLVGLLLFLAAREGLLGKKFQKISVEMVKDKPPEKLKEPEKPPVEPPKAEPPRIEPPKVAEASPPAPATVAPPTVAPPSSEVPGFEFEGGRAVNSESDPVQLYRGYVEYTLRSQWKRPDNLEDDTYVAQVQVHVDPAGHLSQVVWQQGSGNESWDQSVKNVFQVVQAIDRRPPTNFPPQITIRFDVQEETAPEINP